jgi:hypothetical protein
MANRCKFCGLAEDDPADLIDCGDGDFSHRNCYLANKLPLSALPGEVRATLPRALLEVFGRLNEDQKLLE